MATTKQKEAAKKNIKKAQTKWKEMSHREHARAQPEGRKRAKPGQKATGDYYHIEVRPKEQFKTFRTHDVGKPGHIQRVSGKRESGSWSTQKWLISKNDAHIEDKKLVGDTKDAKNLLKKLGSQVTRTRGDRFQAKPRPNIPEHKKPTVAQKKARQKNIRKAQKAREYA